MATAAEYADWIVRNADKKGTPEFETVAKAYKLARSASEIDVDPTAGMSGAEKFAAGVGRGMTELARGVGQRLGLVDQASIDEARKRDEALMSTGAGKAGNITGKVASSLPAILVPGAATLGGAALVGGAQGVAEPTATGESVLKNAAIGAVAGPAGVMLGRGAVGLYQGAKALVAPFTQSGRDQIAGRVLARFADNPASLAAAQGGKSATGATPTLAEQTGDAGVARLQDALRSVDPQINNQIAARLAENNAARVAALEQVAGRGGAADAARAARDTTAKQLYDAAFQAKGALTPSQLKAQAQLLGGNAIPKVLESPAVQEAVKQAQANALNAGKTLTVDGSIEGLHNVKLALDDMIKSPETAAQAAKVAGLKAARDRVVGIIETLSPEYKAARTTYAQMSRPVNGFDVGEEIARRATSNLSDLAGNPRMQANALLGLLRDEPALIQRATGRNVGNQLSDVMDPGQLSLLRQVAGETDRAAAVATAGNGPGSATAQRMAAQNVLRQIVGPTGLPSSWAENALANTVIGKPLNAVYSGVAEPKIQQALAEAVLDPAKARAVLAAAQKADVKLPDNAITRLLLQSARSTATTALVEPR